MKKLLLVAILTLTSVKCFALDIPCMLYGKNGPSGMLTDMVAEGERALKRHLTSPHSDENVGVATGLYSKLWTTKPRSFRCLLSKVMAYQFSNDRTREALFMTWQYFHGDGESEIITLVIKDGKLDYHNMSTAWAVVEFNKRVKSGEYR